MAVGPPGNDGVAVDFKIPEKVLNLIGPEAVAPRGGEFIDKLSPHDGRVICKVARSKTEDVAGAIAAARAAQPAWGATPGVKRGEALFEIAARMKQNQKEIASIVALETGKSVKDALGETGAAISLAQFMAGEGQRFFGRTTASGTPNRHPVIIREPVGLTGLIISANTPIANVAWKVFPSLICGNAALLKASEDTPLTSWFFGRLVADTGVLPPGVLSVIQGYGREAGAALVESRDVPLISFTGSTAVGKMIARVAGERLAKLCLELGGKNPLVVCDDADLENAVKWALLSSFSNAGQRCASSSRIIVQDGVYEKFKGLFVERASKLKVGNRDEDDFGPVINERQLTNMLTSVERAVASGAKVLCGGKRLGGEHARGFYLGATILEGAKPSDEISRTELFGPITCLYRARDFADALKLANDSPYGLTASIHTTDFNRASVFSSEVQAGVAVVNGGTHGSEPHMPFGGVKDSGNGGREPGPEALDVYSNLKVIYQMVDPSQV